MGEASVRYDSTVGRETMRRILINPTAPDALFASAALLAAKRNFVRAIEVLDELAKIDPEYPGLWRFKARMYHELKNYLMEDLCKASAERQESGVS